jgi:hypothetical protein
MNSNSTLISFRIPPNYQSIMSTPNETSIDVPVFEKSSTSRFDIDDVRFLKKFGMLSFQILNLRKSLAHCHSKF